MRAIRPFEVLVVGGGVMGLAALEHLTRLTRGKVALLERFQVGHGRGSSHGAARIARSTYATPVYARFMSRARNEDWARLERDCGELLLHPSSGCFFGPSGGAIDDYLRSVREAGLGDDRVEQLDVVAARRRFPRLRFPDSDYVLDDHTCAVVAAEGAVAAMRRLAEARGAAVIENTKVEAIEPRGDAIHVVTKVGAYQAERMILCPGAWACHLVPALARRLSPRRQTVAYLAPRAKSDTIEIANCPLWVDVGSGAEDTHYALPDLDRGTLKISRHRTTGATDDPEAEGAPDTEEAERLRAVAEHHMNLGPTIVDRVETCLYTCTPSEDFILDNWPGEPRIVVGAGFSGHGFKFAPLVGRVLAELAVEGHTSVEEFASERRRFSIEGPAQG